MFHVFVVTASIIGNLSVNHAHAVERMMTRDDAQRLGLERAWSAQIELDRARHRVERAILSDDRLTVLTTAGVVQEFNALTGECLWTSPVGNASYPSFGPSAGDKYVAIVNGSTLYVLRRQDGKPLLDRRVVGGAPGAGPAVAAEYVFVPLINGRFEGYPLNQGEDKSHTPWYYQAIGRAMVLPKATPKSVVWSTDQGYLYVAASLNPAVRFRLESSSNFIASPAYRPPLVFVATTSGDVYALHESSGERPWKYAAGYSIERAPAAVGDRVYVTTEEPALHCIDAKTGTALWVAPHVTQFAAASGRRVYGIDDLRALVVLDARTGAMLDRMPTDGTSNALVNDQTDRLYLVSSSGRLQCLHEIGAKKPLYHNPPPAVEPQAAPEAKPSTSATRESPPPQEAETPPAEEDENPFRPSDNGGEQPADDGNFGVDSDNPFDFQ
jgi:outer membrane protein assembly factor BamB